MEQRYEIVETHKCVGGNMQIGSVVRHKRFGDIGIITSIYETRITFVIDGGKPWRTYKGAVEVIA